MLTGVAREVAREVLARDLLDPFRNATEPSIDPLPQQQKVNTRRGEFVAGYITDSKCCGTPEWIRTTDLLLRRHLSQRQLVDSTVLQSRLETLLRWPFGEIAGEIAGEVSNA